MHIPQYSFLEKCLHRALLGNQLARKMLLEIDRDFFLPRGRVDPGSVFIVGMPRSGTTILLKLLASTESFSSLSYKDMPLVASPKLAHIFSNLMKRKVESVSRIHDDGISIDLDSPEAFEEVFWLTVGATEKSNGYYNFQKLTDSQLAAFQDYRMLVTTREGSDRNNEGSRIRYLSKNNNNLGRLDEIAGISGADVLLPVRDPVAVARSCWKLHGSIKAIQSKDPFVAEYMDMLGHHEFGQTHLLPGWCQGHDIARLDPSQPDYWLEYWILVHERILKSIARFQNIHIFFHADLCSEPELVLSQIGILLKIDWNIEEQAELVAKEKAVQIETLFDKTRLALANTIYEALRQHTKMSSGSINRVGN